MAKRKPARLRRYEADQAVKRATQAEKDAKLQARGLPAHWAGDTSVRWKLSVDDLVRELERGRMPSRDELVRGRVLSVARTVDRAVATYDTLHAERPVLLRRAAELRVQYVLLAQSLGVMGTAHRVYGDRLRLRSSLRKRPKVISRLVAALQGRADANSRWNARQDRSVERTGSGIYHRGGFKLPRKPRILVQQSVFHDLRITIWSPTRKDPMPKQKVIFDVPESRANSHVQVVVEYQPGADKEMLHPALAIRWYTEQIAFLRKLAFDIKGVKWLDEPSEQVVNTHPSEGMPLVTRSWKDEVVTEVPFPYDDATEIRITDTETYIRHWRWANRLVPREDADGVVRYYDTMVREPLHKWTRLFPSF